MQDVGTLMKNQGQHEFCWASSFSKSFYTSSTAYLNLFETLSQPENLPKNICKHFLEPVETISKPFLNPICYTLFKLFQRPI